LAGLVRERSLEAQVPGRETLRGTDLLFLRYHTRPEESGSEKVYDFSRASLSDRREHGQRDAERACAAMPRATGEPGLRVHRL
jgi:hypothetical protein